MMISRDSLSGETLLLRPERVMLPAGAVAGHAVVVRDGRFADVGPAEDVLARNPGLAAV